MRNPKRALVWGNAFAGSAAVRASDRSVDAFIAESRQFTDRMFTEWIAESRSLASQMVRAAREALPTTGGTVRR